MFGGLLISLWLNVYACVGVQLCTYDIWGVQPASIAVDNEVNHFIIYETEAYEDNDICMDIDTNIKTYTRTYTDMHTDPDTDTRTETHTESHTDTHTNTDTNTDTSTNTDTDTDIAPDTDTDTDTDIISYDDAYSEVEDVLRLSEVDKLLAQNGYGSKYSMSYLVDCISRGDMDAVGAYIKESIQGIFISELSVQKAMMITLIVIVLLGSVFTRFTMAFNNSGISENGFYVTYLIITSVTMSAFLVGVELVVETTSRIVTLIGIIIPVFMVAMNFVGHAMTATASYQMVMLAIWLVETVLVRILLPVIKYYVIISLINNLNKEEYFTRFANMLKNAATSILKGIVLFVVGLNLVKGLVGPQLDIIGRSAASRVLNSFTNGGIASVLTGTFLAAGMVVKNSVGLAAVIMLVILVIGPVLKLFVMRLMFRLVAVIVEPVSDKRYVEGIESLANGMDLLLKLVYSSVVLFVLTIAIMAFATNA